MNRRCLAAVLLQVVGLVLFSLGFLTSRTEIHVNSSCQPPELLQDIPSQTSGCWGPKIYDRVVVLIVDALRSDFVFPRCTGDGSQPHIHSMPKLSALVQNAGSSAIAARFVADTPTITMSRLKALLTGGLPTFLDVGQSFSAARIGEDNLAFQAASQGWRIAFAGDDTWMQLLPLELFSVAEPHPSFNILDLHTVDDGVWKAVQAHLSDPASWDMLAGHYLGVDHAGHAHGVASAAMADKLAQMDDQIAYVADTMLQGAAPGGPYESSLLVVLSDHGQTMGGDHGGSSADETDAVLVAVNIGRWAQDLETQRGKPQAPVQGAQNQAEWQQQGSGRPQGAGDGAVGSQGGATLKAGRCLSSNNGQQEGQHEGAAGTADPAPSASCSSDTQAPPTAPQGVHSLCDAPVVPQLDLTASLALLMGLPIPFSNVGSVDTSLWRALAVRGSDAGLREGAEGDWENGLLSALAANAWQVHAYLHAYSRAAHLPPTELSACEDLYQWAKTAVEQYFQVARSPGVPSNTGVPDSAAHQGSTDQMACRVAEPEGSSGNTTQQCAQDTSPPQSGAETGSSSTQAGGQTGGREELSAALVASRRAAITQLRAFLDAVASMARAKFCGFNLAAMAGGCAVMAAALVIQLQGALKLVTHQSGPPSGTIVAQAAAATRGSWVQKVRGYGHLLARHPPLLLTLAVTLFQAASLFGLDWMMGEGRVMCWLTATQLVALGGSVVWRQLRNNALAKRPSSPGNSTTPEQPAPAQLAAARGEPTPARSGAEVSDGHGGDVRHTNDVQEQRQDRTHPPPLSWWRWAKQVAKPLVYMRFGIAGVVGMAYVGLIDRSGQDPHNKAQTAGGATLDELLGLRVTAASGDGGAGAAGVQAQHAAAGRGLLAQAVVFKQVLLSSQLVSVWLPTVVVCLLMAVVRGVQAYTAARRHSQGSKQFARGVSVAPACASTLWLMLSAWWLVHLVTSARQSSSSLVGSLVHWGVPLLRAGLPRVIYFTSAAFLAGVVVYRAFSRLLPASLVNNPSKKWGPPVAAQTGLQLLEVPVALLLGRRGPLVMMLRALIAHCITRLCCQYCQLAIQAPVPQASASDPTQPSAALSRSLLSQQDSSSSSSAPPEPAGGAGRTEDRSSRGPDIAAGTPPTPAASAPLAPDTLSAGRATAMHTAAVASGAMALHTLASASFFCSGHFAEFTGLQYGAPFIGFSAMHWLISPPLLWLNTFGPTCLTLLQAVSDLPHAVHSAAHQAHQGQAGQQLPGTAVPLHIIAVTWVSIAHSVTTLCVMLCALVLRHHILVWAIIAPRFVFEIFFLTAAQLAAVFACL